MQSAELWSHVRSHAGTFQCVEIGNRNNTREVSFAHKAEKPHPSGVDLPDLSVASFYNTFNRLRLYHHDASGEAAFEFSPPSEWSSLNDRFDSWIDGLIPRELLPDWIDQRLVTGSVPGSANFLLVPTAGPKRGCLFKFDHDGFQFRELAPSVETFVISALDPDPDLLLSMATHMRLIENNDWQVQWWIQALKDNRGNDVLTGE